MSNAMYFDWDSMMGRGMENMPQLGYMAGNRLGMAAAQGAQQAPPPVFPVVDQARRPLPGDPGTQAMPPVSDAAGLDARLKAQGFPTITPEQAARIFGESPAPAGQAPAARQPMTADEMLARAGHQATGLPPVPPALLQSIGPDRSRLQMMGAQPAMSYDGQTMTSRQMDLPAIASAAAGIRPAGDQLVSVETQTRMDPQSIAARIAGQLAPTPEQKAEAFRIFAGMQQGAAGLMNSQENARANQANEALRRQTELAGGVPTALAISQHGALADRVKSIQNSYLATLPRDQNGNVIAKPEDIDAANRLAEAEIQRQGLSGVSGGPPGVPPALLATLPGAAPAQASRPGGGNAPAQQQDPLAAARAQLNKTNADVGDAPLRAIDQATVNMILGEKNGDKWKYAEDPIMALARIKQLLPPDKYANSGDAIKAFMAGHYPADALQQAARPGGGLFANLEPGFGQGRALAWLLGKSDLANQPGWEIAGRALGIEPSRWDAAADLRSLYPQ